MQECPPGLRALLVPRSWGSPAPRGHGARAPAPSQAWHRLPVPARGWGPPGPRHNDGRAACPQPLHPWVRARWVIPIPPGAAATSAHAQHLETLSKPGLLDRPPPSGPQLCSGMGVLGPTSPSSSGMQVLWLRLPREPKENLSSEDLTSTKAAPGRGGSSGWHQARAGQADTKGQIG